MVGSFFNIHLQGIIQSFLLNSHFYLHEFVLDTKQFSPTDLKTDEADYHRGNIYVKLNEHLLSYTLVNIGVLEFGGLLGAFIFNVNGIGKSTPNNNASPAPNTGKRDKEFLFADEQALSIVLRS